MKNGHFVVWARSGMRLAALAGLGVLIFVGLAGRTQAGTNGAGVADAWEVEPVQKVSAAETWVTSGDSAHRTLLNLGSQVGYHAGILNLTGSSQSIRTFWQVAGPCGVLVEDERILVTLPGTVNWVYLGWLALDDCPGSYSFAVTVLYDGESSQSVTLFDVVGTHIYLPKIVR